MRTIEVAHIYSKAVSFAVNQYSIGYITFDQSGDILCLGTDTYNRVSDAETAHRRAARAAAESTFNQYDPNTAYLHCPDVRNPSLVLGRLSEESDTSATAADINIEFTLGNNKQKLVYGLTNQIQVTNWHTDSESNFSGPYTIYIDGSHHYHEDESAVSYVITDTNGRVVDLAAHQVGDQKESLRSEFLAAKTALTALESLGSTVGLSLRTDNHTLENFLDETDERTAPPRLQPLANSVKSLFNSFKDPTVTSTDRDRNTFADSLAGVAHDTSVSLVRKSPTNFGATPLNPVRNQN